MPAILQPMFLEGIFLNGNVWITITISMNFVLKGQINNIPALVEIMAGCRPGDKPLSEAILVCLWIKIISWEYFVSEMSYFL